jgi:hypothetical protein
VYNATITILDNIHRPVFFFKPNVSETGFSADQWELVFWAGAILRKFVSLAKNFVIAGLVLDLVFETSFLVS